MIDYRKYLAHRLAYLYMTGTEVPEGYEIDNINRDRSSNEWSNLRLATSSQNKLNRRASSNTGIKGVYRIGKGYEAKIGRGKVIALGYFGTLDETVTARLKAVNDLHGESAAA